MTSPYGVTVPLLKDVKKQAPQAICELTPTNVARNLIVNRDEPPFDNPDLRRAMALSARPQGVHRHPHRRARATSAARCCRRPRASGACRRRCWRALPGYDPDVAKNRAEAREIMEKLGYGPDKRLEVKVSTRNIPRLSRPGGDPDRPAEGDLHRRRARADRHRQLVPQGHAQGLHDRRSTPTESGVDDPDQTILRELRLRRGAQLHRLLQPASRQADRPAIDRGRPRRSARNWSGRSNEAGRRTAPGRSSSTPRRRDLLAALRQGADDRWSTASTTAGAWKTSGSTSNVTAVGRKGTASACNTGRREMSANFVCRSGRCGLAIVERSSRLSLKKPAAF